MNLHTANTKRRTAVRRIQKAERDTRNWRKGVSLLANFMTQFADSMITIIDGTREIPISMIPKKEEDETA